MSKLSRRGLIKWGVISAGMPAFSRVWSSSLLAQVGGRAQEKLGYPATREAMPDGGQLEIRMTMSPFTNDPDEFEAYQRIRPFSPESLHVVWKELAERNEQKAERFEGEGRKVTAHEFYLRAADFYRRACVRQNEGEPRMVPTYKKFLELFNKAWQLVPPPFERVQVPFEGKVLDGYFRKPAGPAGRRFPLAIEHQGADTSAESSILGAAVPYVARGMAYLVVDIPGTLGAMRLKDLHAAPDTERVAKALVDYAVSRPDVDPNRIGMNGVSMGGYGGPRSATGEKRIKAVWMMSGAYSLLEDIFEFYPPIRDRVRWIIGAKDFADARKKIVEFTLEGRAKLIECPMLIGYSNDDRIMDPQGAFRLYQAAVNSKREMVEGIGHNSDANAGGPRPAVPSSGVIQADWAAKQLVG